MKCCMLVQLEEGDGYSLVFVLNNSGNLCWLLHVFCLNNFLLWKHRQIDRQTSAFMMAPVSEEHPELEQEGKLNQADCLCPICLEIFLEPVTLPCTHTFCKPCFLETVDKANICCPLCRKRVSTWARLNGRKKTLVNTELWMRIQDAFPTQCQRRSSGLDDEEDMSSKWNVVYVELLNM